MCCRGTGSGQHPLLCFLAKCATRSEVTSIHSSNAGGPVLIDALGGVSLHPSKVFSGLRRQLKP